MPKPYIHSKSDVKKFGGNINDYLKIHDFFDSSKAHYGTNVHRTILHHTFGIFLAEQMFGINYELLNNLKEKYNWTEEEIKDIIDFKEKCRINGKNILNSDNKQISVRDIGESHLLMDYGMRFIPNVADYLNETNCRPWMSNSLVDFPESYRKISEKNISFKDLKNRD